MTKSDYELVASSLNKAFTRIDSMESMNKIERLLFGVVRDIIIEEMTFEFRKDNDRFNKEIFVKLVKG